MTLVPGEPQFFSYTCLGDLFSDTDALSDWEESILGTNPLNPDTDGDHLLDDWEYTIPGMNPLNADINNNGIPDGLEDSDGDFENDASEIQNGTDRLDPTKFSDTDGDQLGDAFERRFWGAITVTNDTYGNPDADPLVNLEEFLLRTNPTVAMTNGTHKDGHNDQDNDGVIDLWELHDGTKPFMADADIKKNFVTVTARLERRASWGNIPNLPGMNQQQTYAEMMKNTKLILRARGYETADQTVTTSGAGTRRGVINVLDTNRVPIRAQGDGYFYAAHLLFLRKGVTYDVTLETTNPNLPFVSGRVHWTPVGTGGFPNSTLNDDEPNNRFVMQYVNGRQWYVTGSTGTVVVPAVTLDPNPDVHNTVFTLKGTNSTFNGPGGSATAFSTGTASLLPVELKDIQGPGDEDDRHIQSMAPVPKQEQGESVGAYCQRLNAYYQQQVPDRSIAYIDPHRGTNDSPDMPQLVAKIPGGPEGLKVRWRLEVDYLRGNGYRTRHFTAAMGGDYAHLNEQWGSEEDTVRIPNGTTEGQPNFTAVMNASEEWRIFEAWTSEIAARGFFGGTAKLYAWFPDAQEEAPSDPIMTFRIGGKNPDEAKAKTYINEVVADVDNRLWFSYAIAKHETHGRVREDNVLRYYNQFYNQHQGGPIGDASVDMGWAGWAKAWPLYNLDRYRQGGVRVQNGPGGYGIYQVTGSAQSATAIIPRRTLWNWQDNVKAGMNIIKSKATWVDARYNPLQQTYPGSGPIPTYPLAPTNNRRRLSGWDAYVCTAYNGLDLRSTSRLVRVRINGFKDPQRSCWQPLTGRWEFRHNSNRYCESVYKLIEETE